MLSLFNHELAAQNALKIIILGLQDLDNEEAVTQSALAIHRIVLREDPESIAIRHLKIERKNINKARDALNEVRQERPSKFDEAIDFLTRFESWNDLQKAPKVYPQIFRPVILAN